MKKFFAFLTFICLTAFVYAQSIEDRLIGRLKEYVNVYTQSEENMDTVPSSQCQFGLALLLEDELKSLGAKDVKVDERSYVFAERVGG